MTRHKKGWNSTLPPPCMAGMRKASPTTSVSLQRRQSESILGAFAGKRWLEKSMFHDASSPKNTRDARTNANVESLPGEWSS